MTQRAAYSPLQWLLNQELAVPLTYPHFISDCSQGLQKSGNVQALLYARSLCIFFFFLFKCCEELVNISLVILQLQVLHDLSLASEKLRLVMLPWEGISQRGYKTKYLTPLWSLLPIHPNAALQAKSQQITTIQLWASQNRQGQLGALLLKSRCTGTPPDPCKYAREK